MPTVAVRQASCIMHARDQRLVIASERNCGRAQLDRVQVSLSRSDTSMTAHNRAPRTNLKPGSGVKFDHIH